MSKSILLVDTPESCGKCMFLSVDGEEKYCSFGCWQDDVYELDEKPKCCPLKPVPEKYAVENRWFSIDYANGRNDVIDAILFDESEPHPHDPRKAGVAFRSLFEKLRVDKEMQQRAKMKYAEIKEDTPDRTIEVHRIMHYRCSLCGNLFTFYLEKGLEDNNYTGDLNKPVPFFITCSCGGRALHCLPNADIQFSDYVPLEEDQNYFENRNDSYYGVPHFRNKGIPSEIADSIQKVLTIKNWINDTKSLDKAMREQLEKFDEDDPHNLGNISTSTLKAELRHRKQQNGRKYHD